MKASRTSAILDENDKKRACGLLRSAKLKPHEALPLKVALRLDKGYSVTEIARRYQKSRQNINDIKKRKLSTHDELSELLDDLEGRITTRPNTRERAEKIAQSTSKDLYQIAHDHKVKPEVVLAIAGAEGKDGDLIAENYKVRPEVVYAIADDLQVSLGRGAATIPEYRALLDISSEPVIELAGMYVNCRFSVAVIALHETEKHRTDLVGLFRFPPSILQEEVHWTTVSRVDDDLKNLFSRLRAFLPSSQSSRLGDSVPFVQKVREEYPAPYKLVVIHDIQDPETGKQLDRICHTGVYVPNADFVSRLEHIAHAFRHRRSCAGLFLSASDLNSELPSPEYPDRSCSAMDNGELKWIGSRSNTEDNLRYSKTAQHYLCVRPGILCEMSSTLWKNLPVNNTVLLGEFACRPRADWAQDSQSLDKTSTVQTDWVLQCLMAAIAGGVFTPEENKIWVNVSPIPTLCFKVEVPSRTKDVLLNIRHGLNETDIITRIFYVNGLDINPFIRKSFPFRSADEISELQEKWAQAGGKSRTDKSKPKAGCGVALYPRHFLIETQIPFDALRRYQEQNRFRRPPIHQGLLQLAKDQVECFIFHHPGIILRIWRAFMEERYWRRLMEIDSGEVAAMHQVQYPKTVDGKFDLFYDPNNPVDNFDIEAAADACLEHYRGAHTTEEDVEAGRSKYPTEEDGLYSLICDRVPDGLNKHPVHSNYSASPFLRLFREFDADFLISELDVRERIFLNHLQEELGEEIKTYLGSKLGSGDKINLSMLAKYWRNYQQGYNDLGDWCSEAVESFARNQSRRMLRLSLENAARFAFAGCKPEAIAAVPLAELDELFGKHFGIIARRYRNKGFSPDEESAIHLTGELADGYSILPDEGLSTSKPAGKWSRAEFARLLKDIYLGLGYANAELGGCIHRGIDLRLTDRSGHVFLVKGNPSRTCPVGVRAVRHLYDAMTATNATGAIFVAIGGFQGRAKCFAQGKPIDLVDKKQLLRLIAGDSEPESESESVDDEQEVVPPRVPRLSAEESRLAYERLKRTSKKTPG